MPVVSNSPHAVSPTGASGVGPLPPPLLPASFGALAGVPPHAAATSKSQQTRTSSAPYVDDSPRVMTDR
jgi:hypothetical protein